MKNTLAMLILLMSTSSCLPLLYVDALIPEEEKKKSEKPVVEPITFRPLEITQYETVKFYRHKKMTTRFDCDGHVLSHQLETIKQDLSKTMTINYANRKNAWSYSVLNRRTRTNSGTSFQKEGKFTIDYSPTVFHMRVKEGFNDIEYVFNKCSEISKNPAGVNICTGVVSVEKEGIMQLDMVYEELILAGRNEVRPTPESCQVQP